MKNNFAETLESYMIPANEGFRNFISKFINRKKDKKKEANNQSVNYSKYYEFCEEIYKKLPSDVIAKERALRKKEYNELKNIANSAQRSLKLYGFGSENIDHNLTDFLSCSDYSIFENDLELILFVFDGYEYMDKTYPKSNEFSNDEYNAKIYKEFLNPIDDFIKKVTNNINSKKFSCFKNPDDDWDKYEGFLTVDMKPSEKFMKVAREYGYISWDAFKNR